MAIFYDADQRQLFRRKQGFEATRVFKRLSQPAHANLLFTVTRWVNDGFCRVEEILILSPHGTKLKTSLTGCSKIGEWPFVSFVVRKPGEHALISINKAKGLDSLAVIMIDLQSVDKLSTAQELLYGSESGAPNAGDYSAGILRGIKSLNLYLTNIGEVLLCFFNSEPIRERLAYSLRANPSTTLR